MNNQIPAQQNNNNNNNPRFNNPFNLDPNKEDICINRKLERDMFCPLVAVIPLFGIRSPYYSLVNNEPLNESFFYTIEALIFPNATFFQISMILCYLIIVVFIITLCFGLDETNLEILLPAKLSTVDAFGSFYPKKIKNNPLEFYRLLTFHFFHFNFAHLLTNLITLISLCTFFELLVKKHIFLLILILTGILTNLSTISFFKENERTCGINNGANGILGAFVMLFIMNWQEAKIIFNPLGRFSSIFILCVYIFFNSLILCVVSFGNIILHLVSLLYGAFIFAIITKPIKVERWKTVVRIMSGVIILTITSLSLVSFYLKQ